ncbi:MAG: phosphopantothenate/pantothenate synthetase [Candidatus Hydrothermarchaeales archaeon]
MLPKSHPRFESLRQRDLLIEGYKAGATAIAGLIAFGRGEAYDYLLGEKTPKSTLPAIEASAALLLSAKNPVISINGNTAVLCPRELVKLSEILGAKLEINLFYRTEKRVGIIEKILKENGAKQVYGIRPTAELKGTESERRKVDRKGIYSADVVFVALEDGDRAEALISAGKTVIAVDLNPLSRTAKTASITIVDNIIRAVPLLIETVEKLKHTDKAELEKIVSNYDNEKTLKSMGAEILSGLKNQSQP